MSLKSNKMPHSGVSFVTDKINIKELDHEEMVDCNNRVIKEEFTGKEIQRWEHKSNQETNNKVDLGLESYKKELHAGHCIEIEIEPIILQPITETVAAEHNNGVTVSPPKVRSLRPKHNSGKTLCKDEQKVTLSTITSRRYKEKCYCCDFCNKTFKGSRQLNLHKRLHADDTTTYVLPKYELNDTQQHEDEQKGSLSADTSRLTSDNHERRYCCDICTKKFNRNNHLKVHMRSHTGDKPYCCDICNKKFTTNSHLKVHTRSHTGDKPYCCTICYRKFNKNDNLKVHMRLHTGDKPYCCDICPKKFTQSNGLRAHKWSHISKS